MIRRYLTAIALIIALPAAASAQAPRLTDSRYVAAARCLAYADLPQIAADAPDVTLLRQAYGANLNARPDHIRDSARTAQRLVTRSAGGADPAALRSQRYAACEGFVSSGLAVLQPSGTPDQG